MNSNSEGDQEHLRCIQNLIDSMLKIQTPSGQQIVPRAQSQQISECQQVHETIRNKLNSLESQIGQMSKHDPAQSNNFEEENEKLLAQNDVAR